MDKIDVLKIRSVPNWRKKPNELLWRNIYSGQRLSIENINDKYYLCFVSGCLGKSRLYSKLEKNGYVNRKDAFNELEDYMLFFPKGLSKKLLESLQ